MQGGTIVDDDEEVVMTHSFVAPLLILFLTFPFSVAAEVPVPPQSVLVRLATPSAITPQAGRIDIRDPALRAAFASLAARAPRLVDDGASRTQPLLVLETGSGRALGDALAALRRVPCVLRAEPNYVLVSDTDLSSPSDFYFQTNYWPYYPFTDPQDNPNECWRDWEHCTLTDSVVYNPPPSNFAQDSLLLADGWHLQMTQANLAWLVESGNQNVIVAIIDSGVDWQHPDLAPNMWNNPGEDVGGVEGVLVSTGDEFAPWEFDPADLDTINSDASPADSSWVDDLVGWRFHGGAPGNPTWAGDSPLPLNDPNHGHCTPGDSTFGQVNDQHHFVEQFGYQAPHGTQMASIIGAAHNGFGCAGVVPKVSMMAINAGKSIEASAADTLNPDPSWPFRHGIGIDEMVEGLRYARVKGADIVNISLSYSLCDTFEIGEWGESQELLDAINATLAEGIIICSSAGNTGTNPCTRWPAAIPGVLSCAAVRPDSTKASQSSFGDYVSFCAPSGEANTKDYPYGFPHYRGGEFMAATKWSDPEPLWPQFLPPHKPGEPTGPVHTYKQLNGDTSGAAAQLSGAFALLKAHFPSYSREELISEMIRGAVDVDPYQDPNHPEYIGKLGHGLINPYRSLTEWDGPRASELVDGVVTWSGDVWISGDYAVPSEARLEILPGTTVHIANFDNERQGDPTCVEIQAEQIFALGTEADSIRFVAFGPDIEPAYWVLGNGEAEAGVVQMSYCNFEGMWSLRASGSTTAADSSFITHCSFKQPDFSVVQTLEVSNLHLRSCVFGPGSRWTVVPEDSVRIEWCKFEGDAAENEFMPAIAITQPGVSKCFVENTIIRNLEEGIRTYTNAADSLYLTNVLIEHDHEPGVQERGEVGLSIFGGRVKAEYLTLRGYTVGVSTQGTGKFDAEYSSFTDCAQAALNNPGDYVMFFGYYVEPGNPLNKGGYNVFAGNTKNIANYHYSGTVQARNCWWGSPSGPPAKSNRGRVDTLFYLLADPDLPAPPDFMVLADEPSPPFSVGRNFPNPFNPVTEFTLTVPRGGGLVRATVYDIRGRAVRRLLDKPLASGEHRIEFNGRNDAGEALPSGMYLCRFNFRDREEVVKATLVK